MGVIRSRCLGSEELGSWIWKGLDAMLLLDLEGLSFTPGLALVDIYKMI